MERKEAIEAAQAIIVSVLKGETAPSAVTRDDADVYTALYEMKYAADEYKRCATDAIRTLEQSLAYACGESGRWNSLGILQSTGTRIEQLAAIFPIRVDAAKSALVRYFEAQ